MNSSVTHDHVLGDADDLGTNLSERCRKASNLTRSATERLWMSSYAPGCHGYDPFGAPKLWGHLARGNCEPAAIGVGGATGVDKGRACLGAPTGSRSS